jgi:cholera toxin transcriptional activator
MERNSAQRLFRFGVFEADERTGELRKQGKRLQLQGQPLQVLLLLLARPGELVSRTEIHQRLWPDGTFVDFDHGLNTAINKIREALGDSASSPRFVETLARRGYRFIAPVEVVNEIPAAVVEASGAAIVRAENDAAASSSLRTERAAAEARTGDSLRRDGADTAAADRAPERARRFLAAPEDLPRAPRRVVRTLFLLLQVMYLGFYAVSLARLGIVQSVIRAMMPHTLWAVVLLIVTAAVGIPTRLYLISAAAFNAPGLRERFLKIFPVMFPLDELWALAPFLLAPWIGIGAALGATAALLYAPFAQRSLILMGAGAPIAAGRSSDVPRTNEGSHGA